MCSKSVPAVVPCIIRCDSSISFDFDCVLVSEQRKELVKSRLWERGLNYIRERVTYLT